MTRYKAIISYDGHDFAGFQRQPHARSVQEEIEKTLTKINRGKPVIVHGAGRTDSGVHALGQVIHFNLPQKGMKKNYVSHLIRRHQKTLILLA